jgi:hypothetical protein
MSQVGVGQADRQQTASFLSIFYETYLFMRLEAEYEINFLFQVHVRLEWG